MRTFLALLVVAAAVAISGCAANVVKPNGNTQAIEAQDKPAAVALFITASPEIQASSDWNAFRAEWRTAFESATSETRLPFSYHETREIQAPDRTMLVKLNVNDYRYLTSGARYALGVMIGNAFIDVDAEFILLPENRLVGSRKYTTSSSAWQGIFSAMTNKQVQAIANEIVQELTGR
jgi:hypothetical protein